MSRFNNNKGPGPKVDLKPIGDDSDSSHVSYNPSYNDYSREPSSNKTPLTIICCTLFLATIMIVCFVIWPQIKEQRELEALQSEIKHMNRQAAADLSSGGFTFNEINSMVPGALTDEELAGSDLKSIKRLLSKRISLSKFRYASTRLSDDERKRLLRKFSSQLNQGENSSRHGFLVLSNFEQGLYYFFSGDKKRAYIVNVNLNVNVGRTGRMTQYEGIYVDHEGNYKN